MHSGGGESASPGGNGAPRGQLSQVRVVTASEAAQAGTGSKFDGISKRSDDKGGLLASSTGAATSSGAEASSATLVWSGLAVSVADSQGRRRQILKGALGYALPARFVVFFCKSTLRSHIFTSSPTPLAP